MSRALVTGWRGSVQFPQNQGNEPCYSNIATCLVPLDFTEKNLEALNVAQQLARQNDARVTLLHVIETIDYVADDDIETFYNMLRDRAKRKLELGRGTL